MADDHRLATRHLGRDLVRLIRGYPGWQTSDEGHEQLGLMLERVLSAALEAAEPEPWPPGEKHAQMDRARYAANRTLAEIVKMTPALAPSAAGESVESLAHTLVTLPDVVLQNDPLLIADDLLDRLPLARREATADEIAAYAAIVRMTPALVADPFTRLAALLENWDSYGGRPISPAAIQRAKDWLASVQVVPLSAGGVQLEWHSEGHDVEVVFRHDGTAEMWAEEVSPPITPVPPPITRTVMAVVTASRQRPPLVIDDEACGDRPQPRPPCASDMLGNLSRTGDKEP